MRVVEENFPCLCVGSFFFVCGTGVHPQPASGRRPVRPRHVLRQVSSSWGDRVHHHLPPERQSLEGRPTASSCDVVVARVASRGGGGGAFEWNPV